MSALLLQVFFGIRSEHPADGAVELGSVVPLVRGTFARQQDTGTRPLHEEPRSAAEPAKSFAKFMVQASEPSGGLDRFCWTEPFSPDGTLSRSVGLARDF